MRTHQNFINFNPKKGLIPYAGVLIWGVFCVSTAYATDQFLPTNYDEPYRNQFHFSQQSGWMNDINGLWYKDGVYHLTYQSYPYSLYGDPDGFAPRDWGHATSTDMIHWTQLPSALISKGNVPGECWSGSTVIDLKNTSGLGSIENPPILSFYTAATNDESAIRGTCMAYSLDNGYTWTAYQNNPVNIAGPSYGDRDPKVFWHEASQKWCCVIFQNGMTFYNSPDLKNWTKTSTFNWGWECPDMFELPLDGGDVKKWILLQGDGNYFIGDFDGNTFTPDHKDQLRMVYNEGFGGSFYASQTFFPDNLPGKKIYQIGWMITFGVAGGNTTSPWTHSATLACELKLKTLPEGIRVTRTLVPGFESLYGSTQTWSNQTLNAGHNFFEGKYSKCFDLEVVLDITNATATDVAFKFSDKIINYNVDEQILFRDKLYARNNQVKIRFVVDWGSLEVFGNDGEYSYVEGVKFSPKDQSISMIPNGHIKLVSATLRELKRIWPGDNVNNMYIDGADARNKYTGNWGTGSNERMYFGSDCHIAFEDNCSLETSFTGTHISWYALKNDDLGMASVYIDGVLAEEDIDCYSTNRCVSLLFSKTNLPEGEHTIKVVRNGKKNPASRGFALVHDYFGLEGSFGIESAGDDASVKMKYTGDWNAVTDDLKFYQHTYHKNTSGNGTVEYSFAGTQIYWHGMKDANLGNVSIYIDNVPVADNIDCYAGTPAITRLFAKRDLAKGNHTIKIVAKNTKNELSSGTGFVHDYCDSPELIPLYIDDTSTRNVYTGEWGTGIESIYFNNTCRWASNASIELEFWGNTIEWHALKNNDLGYVTVYIDGKKTEDIDCYSNDRQVVKFFERHNLSNGKHTIKIVTKGEKNPSSNGYAMVHDCFKVQSVPAKSLSVTGHLNFGPVQINTSATQNITITNADLYPVSILGIELPEAYSCNWSKGELQPNESKTVAVTFSPAAIKIYEGNIHIHSNFGTESVFTTGKESTVSSVPDNVKNENINLFPNPVKDKLYVTATDVKTIEILNSTGTVLVKNEVGGENISEIDLSEIPSGALMVKLTKNTKESITAKVIKQ